MFPRAGRLRRGYKRDQVDRYFERAHNLYDTGESEDMSAEAVRAAAFDIVRGGYQPQAVDAALDRLESAFLARRRSDFVAEHGRQAWMDQVAEHATTLYPRLLRPRGERFRPAKGRGYAKAEVDALMERISAYFDSAAPLTSETVRSAAFTAAKRRKAYDEVSVDRYLGRVVEVLLSVE